MKKQMRGGEGNPKSIEGFTLKVVENAGSSLGSVFSNKNLWSGQKCGRDSCNLCSQGEELAEDCKRQNIR